MLSSVTSSIGRRLASQSSRFASTLVVAEADGSSLSASSLSAITAASKIGGDVTVLCLGPNAAEVAKAASETAGVTSAQAAATDAYLGGEVVSSAILASHASTPYSHIVSAASNFGKNCIPRAAASLNSSPVTEVIEVVDEKTFVRPMYAGSTLAKVENSDDVKFLTVRPTAFDKAETSGGSGSVSDLAFEAADATSFISADVAASDRPDLTAAPVVVAGGRGMKNGENFALLETLADKLGGAVGASRAAVDAGFVPNDMQVGQTGKVVAPDLYIAVGISGAIQHLSGMKDSKTIVAINKDKEAPIFQVSDYGLVQDLFDAVPEMTNKV